MYWRISLSHSLEIEQKRRGVPMQVPPPWVFAVSGAFVSIAATLVTNYVAAKKDKARKDVERKIEGINRRVEFLPQAALVDREMASMIKVLEYLVVVYDELPPKALIGSPPHKPHRDGMEKGIIFRMNERINALFVAAADKPPPQEDITTWNANIQAA